MSKGQTAISAVLFAAALFAPLQLYPLFLVKALCFALFAVAFNLLLGYAGLLSFGHAAFFGGGAYIAGYALKWWGVPTEVGLLLSIGGCALIGWLFGSLAIRKEGIYFSMITLGLAQLFFFLCAHARFTGGEDGLQQIPRGRGLGFLNLSSDLTLYYYILAVVLIAIGAVWWIVRSPFGVSLQAISENENRARSLGLEADKFKLKAFVMSAAVAGLAGSLKALGLGVATLTDVEWHMSGEVVLMVLLGGTGTFAGPIVGAIVVVSLENKIGDIGDFIVAITGWTTAASLGSSVPTVIGSIFIVCVLLFRRGIVGEISARMRGQAD